jgi:hypothetical protein
MTTRQIQLTSLEAYFGEVINKIHESHKKVLDVFLENPGMDFSNREIAQELGWSVNCVTPRVYELRGRDKRFPLRRPILIQSRTRKCGITHRGVIAWQINPNWRP